MPSKVRSTPELWSQIRKLTFGMLDGSNLENFKFTKGENGWSVFYKVSSLFNDPSRKLQLRNPSPDEESSVELSWNDVAKSGELADSYTRTIAELTASNEALLAELVTIADNQSKLEAEIQESQGKLTLVLAASEESPVEEANE